MSGVYGLLSLCLSVEPSAAGPRGCPVLYLAGRLLTVSAVSPYTDEWEVSRPFPKLSFPCSNASSRGMAEKTRAPPPAHRPPSRGAPTWRRAWRLNLKCSLQKQGVEGDMGWGKERGREIRHKRDGRRNTIEERQMRNTRNVVGEKEKETEGKKKTDRRWKEHNPLNSEHVNIRPIGVWRGVWNGDKID